MTCEFPAPKTQNVAGGDHRKNGFLVASFPRSGSTLTRDVISTIIRYDLRRRFPRIPAKAPAYDKINILPNFPGTGNERPQELQPYPLILRTHQSKLIFDFQTVFWFRDPVDSIYSYYHLMRQQGMSMELELFCEATIKQWAELAQAALARVAATPSEIHVVRYEDYLKNPVAVFDPLVQFLRLPGMVRTTDAIAQVNARFTHNHSFPPTPAQPSRGTQGLGRKLMPANLRKLIDEKVRSEFTALNALVGPRL